MIAALPHLLVALGYGAAALAAGAGLASVAPVGAVAIIGLAVAFAVCGGLAHLAWTVRVQRIATDRQAEALRARLDELTLAQERVGQEIAQARSEARQIYDALSQAGRAGGGLKEVMAEVRVLQRLVEQLRDPAQTNSPAPAPPALRPEPAPAALPLVPTGPRPPRSMLDTVQEALSAGRVDLLLQPIVTLPQRRRRYYECFSRLRDESGAEIAPDQYFEVAAEAGLLPAIDNLLLFRCIQMIRRTRQRSANIGYFCNISPHSLADRDFLGDVSEFLDENRDLAQSIILETAQSGLRVEDEDLRLQLERLTELGARFSIDQVTELPVDYARLAEWHLKFVKVPAERFADADPEGAWEGSLFQLRRMLGLHGIDLIVEKIETERQLVELLEFNIPFGQGALFGEPKAVAEG